ELEKDKEARLETQFKNCTIVAPGDGVVVYAFARDADRIEEGLAVREGQKLFSLPNIRGPMRVNVKVPEAWVDRVNPGQLVKIQADASAEETLPGTVEVVPPLPDARRSVAPGDTRKFYSTYVRIAKPRPGLRPGFSAHAEILIAERYEVLTVPL